MYGLDAGGNGAHAAVDPDRAASGGARGAAGPGISAADGGAEEAAGTAIKIGARTSRAPAAVSKEASLQRGGSLLRGKPPYITRVGRPRCIQTVYQASTIGRQPPVRKVSDRQRSISRPAWRREIALVVSATREALEGTALFCAGRRPGGIRRFVGCSGATEGWRVGQRDGIDIRRVSRRTRLPGKRSMLPSRARTLRHCRVSRCSCRCEP